MRLLRLADVGSTPSDRVFFYSRIRALLFGFTVLGAAGWILFYSTSRAWKPGYYIAAAVLLFLELIRRFVAARFRPSNWLVRMNDLGLFIQFRSSYSRSWGGRIHVRADLDADFKNCCMRTGRYDGSLPNHYQR